VQNWHDLSKKEDESNGRLKNAKERDMQHLLIITSLLPSLLFASSSFEDLQQQAKSLAADAQHQVLLPFSTAKTGPMARLNADPRFHLSHVDAFGRPVWEELNNAAAAAAIQVDALWPGGESALNLTGANIDFLGIWDGGGVLTSHQELTGRVNQMDNPIATNFHATHVAGTMMASGVLSEAKGMAPQADLKAWDWSDDEVEFMNAAWYDEILVSNHSYGNSAGFSTSGGEWYWHGDPSIDAQEDWAFGHYSSESQFLDEIARMMPHYLMVRTSGNHRNDSGPAQGEDHWIYDNGTWVASSIQRQADGGADGFDSLNPRAAAKNPLIIGSIDAMPNGYEGPESVQLSSFSSHGPTDDGRIKPELVAKGRSLKSSHNSSNTAYATYSGTSMAAPTVTGTVALLQKLFIDGHPDDESDRGGRLPLASSMRAALIHTALEAGEAQGPDYRFGFGLVDAQEAALLIDDENNTRRRLLENELSEGEVDSLYFYSEGGEVRLTLAWTDRHTLPQTQTLNDPTPRLVNDLDLQLQRVGAVDSWMSWGLDPANPAAAAQPTGNHLDNVELLEATLEAGSYLLLLSHSGALADDQSYSLTWSGLEIEAQLGASSTNLEPLVNDVISLPITLKSALGLQSMDLSMSWNPTAFEFVSFTQGAALSQGQTATQSTLSSGDDHLNLLFDRQGDQRGLDLPTAQVGVLELRSLKSEWSTVEIAASIHSAADESGHRVQGQTLDFNQDAPATPIQLSLDLEDVQLHLGETFSPEIHLDQAASLRAIVLRVEHGSALQLVLADNLSPFDHFTLQAGDESSDLIWNHPTPLFLNTGQALARLELRLMATENGNLSLLTGSAVHEGGQSSDLLGDSLATWFQPHLPSGGYLVSPANGSAVTGPTVHMDWSQARDPYLGTAVGYSVIVARQADMNDIDTLYSAASETSFEFNPGMHVWTLLTHYELGAPVVSKQAFRFFAGLSEANAPTEALEPGMKDSAFDENQSMDADVLDAEGESTLLPQTTSLKAPYPNPFNPSVQLPLDLARSEHVQLSVFDLLGRRVALLVDETLPAGSSMIEFKTDNRMASGVYLVVLQTSSTREIRKIQLIR
jgi:hypothetical protein